MIRRACQRHGNENSGVEGVKAAIKFADQLQLLVSRLATQTAMLARPNPINVRRCVFLLVAVAATRYLSHQR